MLSISPFAFGKPTSGHVNVDCEAFGFVNGMNRLLFLVKEQSSLTGN